MYLTLGKLTEEEYEELGLKEQEVASCNLNFVQLFSDIETADRNLRVIIDKEILRRAERIRSELRYSYKVIRETSNFKIISSNVTQIKKTLYYTSDLLPLSFEADSYLLAKIYPEEIELLCKYEKDFLVLTEEKLGGEFKPIKLFDNKLLYEWRKVE